MSDAASSRKSRTVHWADLLPSTDTICPVRNEACSNPRKTIAFAISSGSPARLSGTPAISAVFFSSLPVKRFSIPVSMGPGATALTRTPNAARATADFHQMIPWDLLRCVNSVYVMKYRPEANRMII
jgi:hypothetical protein